jgi:hypothetical protein
MFVWHGWIPLDVTQRSVAIFDVVLLQSRFTIISVYLLKYILYDIHAHSSRDLCHPKECHSFFWGYPCLICSSFTFFIFIFVLVLLKGKTLISLASIFSYILSCININMNGRSISWPYLSLLVTWYISSWCCFHLFLT